MKKTKKRVTPEDDFRRLAERLNNEFPQITDRETFDQAFDVYMQDVDLDEEAESIMKDKAFKYLRKIKPGKITVKRTFGEDEALYKIAGGNVDNLAKDRQRTANIVKDKKRYVKVGATKADFPGLDTKRTNAYGYLGRVKHKVVYARRERIRYGKKFVVKYRDKRGRFVSVRLKK